MTQTQLDRVEEKVDKALEHVASIDVTIARQAVTLEEHVKRSTQLEERVLPIEKHVMMVSGIIRFLGILAAIATIIELITMVKR